MRDRRDSSKRWKVAFWTLGWLMGAAFIATIMQRPAIALAIAPLIVIPWARGTRNVTRAALGGAGFGLVTGLTIAMALQWVLIQAALSEAAQATTQPATAPATAPAEDRPAAKTAPATQPATAPATQPGLTDEAFRRIHSNVRRAAVVLVPATMIACAASAALFSWLIRLRERRIDREWMH